MTSKEHLNRSLNGHIFQHKYIVDRLICPVCQHKASPYNTFVKCTNIACEKEFPLINHIPIMINEENSIFSIENFQQGDQKKSNKTKNRISKLKNFVKFVPSISNNLSSKKNFLLLDKLLADIANPKILVIGGATITTDTEMIFNPNNLVIETDVYFGPRTQMIVDAHHIPFEKSTFDLIIFQAVLEHVADPYQCVKEAHRVLKRDGLVFSSTPFMQQVHMKHYDFTRFTYLGHRRLFRSFVEIESGVFAGTGVALAWSIKYFVKSLTNNKPIRIILQVSVSFLFFWLKYIDLFIYDNKGTYDGASGFYFIGRKSDTTLSDKELIKHFKGND